MRLSDYDKNLLDGSSGPALQEAMELLVKFGTAFEAPEMIDAHRAHLFADYHTIGEPSLEIYERFAKRGAKVKIPTTDEPISMDPEHEDDFMLPSKYLQGQWRIVEALRSMRVKLTHSNSIYLTDNVPQRGENLAWVESSAVGWANSVVGARGNREGAITSLMAALTGRIPKYGLLDDRNRKGQILFEIEHGLFDQLKSGAGEWLADFHALGAAIGDIAYDRIPVITGLPKDLDHDRLKAICAMCSPSYTNALILMVGISPEAPTVEAAFGGAIPKDVEVHSIGLKHVKDTYEKIQTTRAREITGVLSGCPYKTVNELQEVADLLEGKKINPNIWVWITTDQTTRDLAREVGLVQRIEKSGAKIYANTCHFMQPIAHTMAPDQVIATDSMKMPRLLGGRGKAQWVYGSLKDCLAAATQSGKFISTRWT